MGIKMAKNRVMVGVCDDTKQLLDQVREELSERDEFARTDYDSLIKRISKYWLFGDVDK